MRNLSVVVVVFLLALVSCVGAGPGDRTYCGTLEPDNHLMGSSGEGPYAHFADKACDDQDSLEIGSQIRFEVTEAQQGRLTLRLPYACSVLEGAPAELEFRVFCDLGIESGACLPLAVTPGAGFVRDWSHQGLEGSVAAQILFLPHGGWESGSLEVGRLLSYQRTGDSKVHECSNIVSVRFRECP